MSKHRGPKDERPAQPGDGLLRTGGVLFLIGVVAIVATVVPHPLRPENKPLWLNLLCYSAALGFGLVLVGLVVAARASHAEERRRSR